jgi:hypothetical protein
MHLLPIEMASPTQQPNTCKSERLDHKQMNIHLGHLETPNKEACCPPLKHGIDPVESWVGNHFWPRDFFQSGNMSHLLARKGSASASSGSKASSTSQILSREVKSASYNNPNYKISLAGHGSFMTKSRLGITNGSQKIITTLLNTEQAPPHDTIFRDDSFESTCEELEDENETMVMLRIMFLIVPSARNLAALGATHLRCLTECANRSWRNCISITKVRPQPDYCVGFGQQAFTEHQQKKLKPFVGDANQTSLFMATYYMYLPFLTCEVKCGTGGLDNADRQNAHSMTIAVRAIVELFRLVKRESEIHCQILAFSISHDNRNVRIYGHYPVIHGDKTTYYRHPIYSFDFTTLNGKEKWTAYRFTKNVYNIWMPAHLKNICSAIDAVPDNLNINIDKVSQQLAGLSHATTVEKESETDSIQKPKRKRGRTAGTPQ